MQEVAHTRRERRRAPGRRAARLATTTTRRQNPKPPATEAMRTEMTEAAYRLPLCGLHSTVFLRPSGHRLFSFLHN